MNGPEHASPMVLVYVLLAAITFLAIVAFLVTR